MRKVSLLLAILVALATYGAVQRREMLSEIQSIIKSETDFCKASIEKRTREAFLTYLADDGIIFRPKPVNGRQWMHEHPSSPGVLTWAPRKAEVSLAADYGYTTGPWEFKANDSTGEVVRYGYYVTIWKKQSDGKWKVALDVGVTSSKPDSSWKLLTPPKGRPGLTSRADREVDIESEKTALLKADRDFSGALSSGSSEACLSYLSHDAIFLRANKQPLTGPEAMQTVLPEKSEQLIWRDTKAEVSRLGDFGYTYGVYEGKAEQGNYVRIWQKRVHEKWGLALDVTVPSPPAQRKSTN